MDYKTRPLTREKIRILAFCFRKLFDVPPTGPFPVLEALEKIPEVFVGSNVEIVPDEELGPKVVAQCTPNENGGFTIKVAKSIYDGAYKNNTGAFLGFILHEICHVFLFEIGFTPIYERAFENNSLPAYKSVEWQAKALTGEVMMPYEECKNMSCDEIEETYHVSKSCAKYFKKNIVKGSESYAGKEKTH